MKKYGKEQIRLIDGGRIMSWKNMGGMGVGAPLKMLPVSHPRGADDRHANGSLVH